MYVPFDAHRWRVPVLEAPPTIDPEGAKSPPEGAGGLARYVLSGHGARWHNANAGTAEMVG
jgi:hypothetical protein